MISSIRLVFTLSLLIQLAATSFAQAKMPAGNELEWNSTNLTALATMSCVLYSDKSEVIQHRDQFLFHELNIAKDPAKGSYLISGNCARALDGNGQLQPGDLFSLEINPQEFKKNTDPVLMAVIGEWSVKFYFKSVTVFDGTNLKVQKILDRVALFHIGTSAAQSFLRGLGYLGIAWYGSESLSPAKWGTEGAWQTSHNAELDFEGIGPRNAEAFRIWSFNQSLHMNTSELVQYWQGVAGNTGGKADAVFFPLYSTSQFWRGCSYLVSSDHKMIDESLCQRLWSQVK